MRYCDLTLAYTASSGGIRTYIDAKRRHLQTSRPGDEHVLLVPGEQGRIDWEDRLLTVRLASPVIPGCAPYRFFWRPDRLLEALEETRPDIVELGSFFSCPWAAFQYRERRRAAGKRCLVSAYFHTDIADAYFGATLRKVVGKTVAQHSATLANWGVRLSERLEHGAERYFGGLFEDCDLLFAATAAQRRRMGKYGIPEEAVDVVPLGTDLELFHPEKRREDLRAGLFGAAPETAVFLYAGRLDPEKHVDLLVRAFAEVRLPDARLVLTGEGPLREGLEREAEQNPRLLVLPYQPTREAFAAMLASADVYATAGPHETFGLSVVEAQASGLPVVGVDAGALTERVVPGTGFLGPAGDAVAMARHLERAAAERAVLGPAARRHVEESGVGWEGTFAKLFECYRSAWERA
jgi:alpha-1,6-mannosyltransferase